MANKRVPDQIAGVELHSLAKERTRELLLKLEISGVEGISTGGLSMIDRFRLLASSYFKSLLDKSDSADEASGAEADCCGNCNCDTDGPGE